MGQKNLKVVEMGAGPNLIDHSIRSILLSGCRMSLCSVLASGPGKFHLEEARGLLSNIFLNRRFHWEEVAIWLSVFQGRRERLLD